MNSVYEQLSEPFPPEFERILNKSGTQLIYLPIAEVTNRMNRVLGVGKWSSEVIRCERDSLDPEWVIAHVRISAEIDGTIVARDGIGGQQIKRKKNGDILDLGDEFKGAVSDATKKAMQQFGVGLYLARDIDAIEIENAIDEEEKEPTPEEEAYSRFMEMRGKLDEEQLKQLRQWWNEYSGGRPVPKQSELTLQEIEAMVTEVVRITFDGTLEVSGEDD